MPPEIVSLPSTPDSFYIPPAEVPRKKGNAVIRMIAHPLEVLKAKGRAGKTGSTGKTGGVHEASKHPHVIQKGLPTDCRRACNRNQVAPIVEFPPEDSAITALLADDWDSLSSRRSSIEASAHASFANSFSSGSSYTASSPTASPCTSRAVSPFRFRVPEDKPSRPRMPDRLMRLAEKVGIKRTPAKEAARVLKARVKKVEKARAKQTAERKLAEGRMLEYERRAGDDCGKMLEKISTAFGNTGLSWSARSSGKMGKVKALTKRWRKSSEPAIAQAASAAVCMRINAKLASVQLPDTGPSLESVMYAELRAKFKSLDDDKLSGVRQALCDTEFWEFFICSYADGAPRAWEKAQHADDAGEAAQKATDPSDPTKAANEVLRALSDCADQEATRRYQTVPLMELAALLQADDIEKDNASFQQQIAVICRGMYEGLLKSGETQLAYLRRLVCPNDTAPMPMPAATAATASGSKPVFSAFDGPDRAPFALGAPNVPKALTWSDPDEDGAPDINGMAVALRAAPGQLMEIPQLQVVASDGVARQRSGFAAPVKGGEPRETAEDRKPRQLVGVESVLAKYFSEVGLGNEVPLEEAKRVMRKLWPRTTCSAALWDTFMRGARDLRSVVLDLAPPPALSSTYVKSAPWPGGMDPKGSGLSTVTAVSHFFSALKDRLWYPFSSDEEKKKIREKAFEDALDEKTGALLNAVAERKYCAEDDDRTAGPELKAVKLALADLQAGLGLGREAAREQLICSFSRHTGRCTLPEHQRWWDVLITRGDDTPRMPDTFLEDWFTGLRAWFRNPYADKHAVRRLKLDGQALEGNEVWEALRTSVAQEPVLRDFRQPLEELTDYLQVKNYAGTIDKVAHLVKLNAESAYDQGVEFEAFGRAIGSMPKPRLEALYAALRACMAPGSEFDQSLRTRALTPRLAANEAWMVRYHLNHLLAFAQSALAEARGAETGAAAEAEQTEAGAEESDTLRGDGAASPGAMDRARDIRASMTREAERKVKAEAKKAVINEATKLAGAPGRAVRRAANRRGEAAATA